MTDWHVSAPARRSNSIWRRITALVLAASTVAVLADALSTATPIALLATTEAPGSPVDLPWSEIMSGDTAAKRSIKLRVENQAAEHGPQLIVQYEVNLAADSELLVPLEAYEGSAWIGDVVDQVLGAVRVTQWPLTYSTSPGEAYDWLTFKAPRIYKSPDGGAVRVEIESQPYWLLTSNARIWLIEPLNGNRFDPAVDEVIVSGGRTTVEDMRSPEHESQAIVSQDSSTTVIDRRRMASPYFPLDVEANQTTGAPAALWVAGQVALPAISWGMWRFATGVVPVLLLYALIRRDKQVRRFATARGTLPLVKILLVLACGAAALGLVIDLSLNVGIYGKAVKAALLALTDDGQQPDWLPTHWLDTHWVASGAYGLTVAAALVLWPVVILSQRKEKPPRAEPRHGKFTGVLVLSGTLVLWSAAVTYSWLALTENEIVRLPVEAVPPSALVALAVGASGLFASSAVLVRLVSGSGPIRTAATAMAFASVALATAVLGPWLSQFEDRHFNVVIRAVGVVVSIAIVAGLAGAVVHWVRRVAPERTAVTSTYAAVTITLAILLLTIPWVIVHAFDRRPNAFHLSGAVSLIDELQSVSYLLLAGMLVLMMREASRLPSGEERVRVKRRLLIVFVVLNFYWFDILWFFVPVQPAVGAALAVWFALPSSVAAGLGQGQRQWRTAGEGNGGGIVLRPMSQWAGVTERLQKVARTLRPLKGKDRSSGGATVDPQEHGNAVTALAPFERENHSWADAVRGALVGAIVGAPWVVMAFGNFSSAPVLVRQYPALGFLGYELLIILQWPMYGFFYGFASPFLRGTHYLSKALTTVLLVLVPLSMQSLFLWQSWDLISMGFFALKMLTFGLVLGAAFEVSVLRRAGLEWRSIAHQIGVRGIVGWSSSLLVALGAAVATGFSEGVGGVMFEGPMRGMPGLGP